MPLEYLDLVPGQWPPVVCGGSPPFEEAFRCFRLRPSDDIEECDWLDGIDSPARGPL